MQLDDDETRLGHILEAAREAVGYVAAIDRATFEASRPLQHAVVRCIEIVGEAEARLSPGLREANPQIPWPRIIATRNRIVHAYFDVDMDIIWTTATVELPTLIHETEKSRAQLGEARNNPVT